MRFLAGLGQIDGLKWLKRAHSGRIDTGGRRDVDGEVTFSRPVVELRSSRGIGHDAALRAERDGLMRQVCRVWILFYLIEKNFFFLLEKVIG